MTTKIRTELSNKNEYYISKYRYLELKYFCLQYDDWKKEYDSTLYFSSQNFPGVKIRNTFSDSTGNIAVRRSYLAEKLKLVEQTAIETDEELFPYLILSVTKGLTYNELYLMRNMPCGRTRYYKLYRKFFYLLSQKKLSC